MIRDLESPDLSVREAAERRLLAAGDAAYGPLEGTAREAARKGDPDLELRARNLLDRIGTPEIRAKVERFLGILKTSRKSDEVIEAIKGLQNAEVPGKTALDTLFPAETEPGALTVECLFPSGRSFKEGKAVRFRMRISNPGNAPRWISPGLFMPILQLIDSGDGEEIAMLDSEFYAEISRHILFLAPGDSFEVDRDCLGLLPAGEGYIKMSYVMPSMQDGDFANLGEPHPETSLRGREAGVPSPSRIAVHTKRERIVITTETE